MVFVEGFVQRNYDTWVTRRVCHRQHVLSVGLHSPDK